MNCIERTLFRFFMIILPCCNVSSNIHISYGINCTLLLTVCNGAAIFDMVVYQTIFKMEDSCSESTVN